MQPGSPAELLWRIFNGCTAGEFFIQRCGKGPDPPRLMRIDVVTLHELGHRDIAHVVVVETAEHVVEDALAHRAGGRRHFIDVQFVEHRIKNRQAADQHRLAVGA